MGCPGGGCPKPPATPGLLSGAGRVEVKEGVAGRCSGGTWAGQSQIQASARPVLTACCHPRECAAPEMGGWEPQSVAGGHLGGRRARAIQRRARFPCVHVRAGTRPLNKPKH